MRESRLLLSCLLGVLTMSAVVTGNARAVESTWMIGGEAMPALSLKEEKLSLSGAITIAVPGKIVIECSVVENVGKIFENGTNELNPKLTKCTVTKAATCKVTEPLVMEAKFEPIHVSGAYYAKLVPLKEGSSMMTIKFNEECPFSGTVKGAVAAEMSLENKEKQPLKFSEAITKKVNEGLKSQGEAELGLTLSAQTAYLSGELKLALSGENKGKQVRDAPATKLCEVVTEPCPGNKTLALPQNVKIEHEGNVKFKYIAGAAKEVICVGWKMTGTLTRNFGNRGPVEGTNLVGSFMANGCTIGGVVCAVTVVNGPWVISLTTTGIMGRGLIGVARPGFKLVCGGKTCVYEALPELELFFYQGGTPAKAKRTPFNLIVNGGASDAECSVTALWEAEGGVGDFAYKFAEPASLFLTS